MLRFDGASSRREREHNERAWLAWHTAALARPSKGRFPSLRSLQVKPRRKPQTWQEQLEVARLWTVAMGGKISKH
jgi:hypothetical protein